MRALKVLTFQLLFIPLLSINAQVYLTEGFETGSKPDGWTEERVSGDELEPWRYRNGGHNPFDNNWLVPADEEDIARNPPSAYDGTYNAIFFKQGDNNEKTKLITPELNLLGGTNVVLSFYLCQIPWNFEGSLGWDVLRVFYKTSEDGNWQLLHEYLDPVLTWEPQSLILPNPNETYYVAFEGHTRWGFGTCIDNVQIEETGSQPMYISEIEFAQPFKEFAPSGSKNVPVLRADVKVLGNEGSVTLNTVSISSLNSDDNDIEQNSIKLYATGTQEFKTDNLLGTATEFVNGKVTFNNLGHTPPRGLSYLWLTIDIKPTAKHGNIIDVEIKANDIEGGGDTFPPDDESPISDITIYETIYQQDFEGAHGWTLTGEFEAATPN